MSLSFEISAQIPASPGRIFRAWLDSREHGAMTGGSATVSGTVGGAFEAWDGYITGRNLELVPESRIVQAWRTVEFGPDEPDSRLEIVLEAVPGGTKLTLRHSDLPPHGAIYRDGWVENYFEPMTAYFSHSDKVG